MLCVPALVEPLLAMEEAGGPAVFLDSSEWLFRQLVDWAPPGAIALAPKRLSRLLAATPLVARPEDYRLPPEYKDVSPPLPLLYMESM